MNPRARWVVARLRGPDPGAARAHAAGWVWMDVACLAVITAVALLLLAPDLGHPGIRDWDESIHQAVARGTLKTPLTPHLYEAPLYPTDPAHWWASGVWMHKPPAPFWFAAAVMKGVGVTPLAWRLGGLLGYLGAAWALFLLARGTTGRLWALVASLAFVSLPFGWKLTQGFFFGDATDLTLTGWVTVAMLLLVRGGERDRWGWWALAGAAVGVAVLCKSVLGLVPLGTGFLLGIGRLARLTPGPRLGHFLAMFASAAAVALPWNLYAARKWPAEFQASLAHTFGHISDAPAEVGPWVRPWDAIWNELMHAELQPLPVILPLVAAIVLGVRAVRHRELPVVATAIWLWATWIIHAFMAAKVPAQIWSAVPAVFFALAILIVQSLRSPVTAVAAITAVLTPWLIDALPFLGTIRAAFPPPFAQTRELPGLAEGLLLCGVAAGVTAALQRSRLLLRPVPPPHVHSVFDPKPPPVPKPELRTARGFTRVALAVAATLALATALLGWPPRALLATRAELYPELWISHSADLGPALDRALPEQSVLFQDVDADPRGVHEVQALMFYSGRMVYRGPPDLTAAHAKGYHAFLVSPAGERFAPVGDVPAHAWLRAYDPLKPLEPTPLPAGLTLLNVEANGLHVFGYAAKRLDDRVARYAFYVSARGTVPGPLELTFILRDGQRLTHSLAPEASLRRRERLARADWFILPVLGPPLEMVAELQLGEAAPVRVAADAATP